MSRSLTVLAASALGLAASSALAQHAEWVFIGGANPAAAEAAPEHRFVHPLTSPYFHEDSFVTSDVRAWYAYHDIPNEILGGGSAQVLAVQVRLAITKELQLVAYKDGLTIFDTDGLESEGFNDIGAGLKWNFLQDFKHQLHASVGVGYEFPWGESDALQNNEEARVWASINKGFNALHLGGTVNAFFTPDDEDGGDYLSWHLHADYYLCKWFSPVAEVNGYHFFDEVSGAGDLSGIDVTNLGGGDDVITMGLGGEIRPFEELDLGLRAAYEFPLTDETDLYGWRITCSAIFSF